jgi:hypothetical protein
MLTAAIAAPKISFETVAMTSFSASNKTMFCYLRAEDWITLPQIPSHFLEHNADPVCGRHTTQPTHALDARRDELRLMSGSGGCAGCSPINTIAPSIPLVIRRLVVWTG